MKKNQSSIYSSINKRIGDILLSILLLALLSPLFLVLYILLRSQIGKPVLFAQKRPGLNGEIFTMYKFRTMTNEKDEFGNLLPNELRHTKFGKIIRGTSLDELPELINVLRGDMSLVGPRPLLVEYLPLYTQKQSQRHNVKPGITGYAQVNGRNSLTWEEKFEKDIYYVENLSFLLDIKILLKTVKKVLVKENINQDEDTTMERFKGSN